MGSAPRLNRLTSTAAAATVTKIIRAPGGCTEPLQPAPTVSNWVPVSPDWQGKPGHIDETRWSTNRRSDGSSPPSDTELNAHGP